MTINKAIFYIKYYARKHGKIIERKATLNEDCYEGVHKIHGHPYKKYFDIEADGIRTESFKWEINEQPTLKNNLSQ